MGWMLVLVTVAVAGCLGGIGDTALDPGDLGDGLADGATTFDPIGEPLVQEHAEHEDYNEGHTDGRLHTARANVEQVAWVFPLPAEEIGDVGFAGFTIWEHYAFVNTDGRFGGFFVVDIEDPTRPEVIGRYTTDAAASQDPKVSPDGNWLFLHVQSQPTAPERLTDGDGLKDGGLGVQVIDISDKTDPQFAAFVPVELFGSHNTYPYQYDTGPFAGQTFLFYTGQPIGPSVAGNYVVISHFAAAGGQPQLTRLSHFHLPGAATAIDAFPHDMFVFEHPETGQVLLYVAYWGGGAAVADVTNPLAPVVVGVYDDPAPSKVNNIHSFLPYRTLNGTHYSFSTPEIGSVEGETGLFRVYDTTDPASPDQVGHWELPGDLEIRGEYRFSPHNFGVHPDRPLVALAHYHAGVWVLNVSDPVEPRAVGFYLPHGNESDPYHDDFWHKTPNFDPVGFLPATYDARWYEGYLLVSDRSSGFYVLNYTGPGSPPITV